MKAVTIGILTWRNASTFAEPRFFRQWVREGERIGCHVFLFSPQDVNFGMRSIYGYRPTGLRGWKRQKMPWPDVVIDRYRYSATDAFKRYVAFRKKKGFLYANQRLANKWKVHQVLSKDELMLRWLPDTRLYTAPQLRKMLNQHHLLYVKPVNGTGGRGILRVERTNRGYRLLGRDRQREKRVFQLTSLGAAAQQVHRWVKSSYTIIQQGLNLNLQRERAVDMRLLLQKNKLGQWAVTGHGIRVGGEKSATSNLHGGGKAIASAAFLRPIFGAEKTQEILSECESLSFRTAQVLEQHFGRMMEFGLDIGIDVDGRIWLIEVNPKPGREIFKEMGVADVYRQAIRQPLEYAVSLVKQTSV